MSESNYTQATPKWTRESILALIQEKTVGGYCKSTDVGMSATAMAKRLFGSFAEALSVAGVALWSDRPRPMHCAVDGCERPLRSGRALHCEVHYYRLRRNGTIDASCDTSHYEKCVYCNKEADGRRFCDGGCRSRFERGTPLEAPCRVCAMPFKPINSAICCSTACDEKFARIKNREWYARNMIRPEVKARIRFNEYKRKALRADAFIEEVDRDVVYKRDKGVCWLCGGPVDRSLVWPDLGFATLDHVVPLKRGGMHCYSNVRLAHLRCNCSKGARMVVDAGSNGLPLPASGQTLLF